LEVDVRPLSAAFLIALLLSVSVVAVAQQTSPTPAPNTQDGQAVSVIKAALSGLTGPSAAVPVSLVASGTYTRWPNGTAVSFPIQLKVLGTTSVRWDASEPSGSVTTIVNGLSGSVQTPSVSRALAIGETFGRGVEIFPALLITKWMGTTGLGMMWVGPEALNGQSVNHTTVLPPATASPNAIETQPKCEFYTDPQTNRPIRVRVYQHPTDRRAVTLLDIDFSNYQSVSGMMFPMTVSFSTGGQTIATIQFQSIAPNASVSASEFIGSLP
jgi:outer membrane lipoprotein-sorting protein